MALIAAFQQLRISGELVTSSGSRIQVGSDNTLMVRDSGAFATTQGLAATGSAAWNAANNNGINLSGNLTQTGITLVALNLNTSGVLAALISANAAGVGSVNGLSGSLDLLSASPGVSFVTSGNTTIYLSGAASHALVTGMSGQLTTDLATKAQLTSTGVQLGATILLASGWLATGLFNTGAAAVAAAIVYANSVGVNASGTIAATGQQAYLSAVGAATALSGQLTNTGVALLAAISAFSGFYTGSQLSYYSGLSPTGFDSYLIGHLNHVFPSIPKVVVELELSNSTFFYSHAISSRTTSGFILMLSDVIGETGVGINVLARI